MEPATDNQNSSNQPAHLQDAPLQANTINTTEELPKAAEFQTAPPAKQEISPPIANPPDNTITPKQEPSNSEEELFVISENTQPPPILTKIESPQIIDEGDPKFPHEIPITMDSTKAKQKSNESTNASTQPIQSPNPTTEQARKNKMTKTIIAIISISILLGAIIIAFILTFGGTETFEPENRDAITEDLTMENTTADTEIMTKENETKEDAETTATESSDIFTEDEQLQPEPQTDTTKKVAR